MYLELEKKHSILIDEETKDEQQQYKKFFKFRGDQKSINIALAKLDALYNDPTNHLNQCELSAAPKPSEISQIVDYVKRVYDCKVEIKKKFMTIRGL